METSINKPASRYKSIFTESCPHCRQSKVFAPSAGLFSMPVMKESCDNCGYKFDREPGYFLGAMYISYGLGLILAGAVFFLFYFWFPHLPLIYTPLAITLALIISAKKNYKLSRIVYIHIFPW